MASSYVLAGDRIKQELSHRRHRCPSMNEQRIKETTTEARQSVKVGAMRYVLGVGLAGATIGLLLAWLFFTR